MNSPAMAPARTCVASRWWLLTALAIVTPAACKQTEGHAGHGAEEEACGPCDLNPVQRALTDEELAAAAQVNLAGAIDLHAHSAPDNVERSHDDFEVAQLAKAAGMRAVVLKSHIFPTAARAALTMKVVPGIDVWGGLSLNRSVGGLNIEALREMVAMPSKRGKVVWLPTRDSARITVVRDGAVVPELAALFPIMAANDMVLATGHTSPANSLIVIDAAKAAGVTKILVTHPMSTSVGASLAHMQAMAEKGAYLELVYLAVIGVPGKLAEYAAAIRAIGAEHFVLSSDLGQVGNPDHATGLRLMIAGLMAEGITQAEINRMVRANPSKLLGVEE